MLQRNKNKLKEKSLDSKFKTLILLSLINEKIHKNKEIELEKIFLINKEYLDSLYFSEINKLIIENENIQNKLKDIKIAEISKKNLDTFLEDLDYGTFINYNNEIKKMKKIKISYEVQKEEIKLSDSEKVFVYKDFYVIYNKNEIIERFKKKFKISFFDSNMKFVTIKEREIILDNKNNIIYFLNQDQNKENISYKIEYIFLPKVKDCLIFNNLYSMDILGDQYFNKTLSFNKGNQNRDYISTIFVNDKIIGNCYKYNPSIKDYTNLIDYNKYLQYEDLTNILSLYSCYILKKKITKSFETSHKYYLVNSKFMNEIKIKNNFSEIYNCLEKNINNIYIDEKANIKNIYFMIKNLPIDLMEEYADKKINNEYNLDDIEPLQAEINYNEKEPLN